jgi:hypothetical protein
MGSLPGALKAARVLNRHGITRMVRRATRRAGIVIQRVRP